MVSWRGVLLETGGGSGRLTAPRGANTPRINMVGGDSLAEGETNLR